MKRQTPLWLRLAVVLSFIGFGAVTVIYLLVHTGRDIPLIGQVGDYKLSMTASNVDNLEQGSHVEIAGVQIGLVESREVEGDHARIVVALDSKYAPLHEGVSVRVGAKSLVEETYLDMTDGRGEPLPNGATLPADAVRPITQISDVVNSLNPKARQDLSAFLRSSGPATADTRESVSQMLAGLGSLGGQGHDALDAIAGQSEDLRALVKETTAVLTALDTGEGEIARLTTNADTLTKASADRRAAIEGTFRRLPGVLDSARTATAELNTMAGALGPVASDLNRAAPNLSEALDNLPDASRDLRGSMAPLADVLDRGPETLDRVPTLGGDLRDHLIPSARDIFQDLNPMLEYMRPYGVDLGAYVALNGAAWGYHDEAGTYYFRLMQLYNDASVHSPIAKSPAFATYNNAVPKAGAGAHPGPFTGQYPRVERAPR